MKDFSQSKLLGEVVRYALCVQSARGPFLDAILFLGLSRFCNFGAVAADNKIAPLPSENGVWAKHGRF